MKIFYLAGETITVYGVLMKRNLKFECLSPSCPGNQGGIVPLSFIKNHNINIIHSFLVFLPPDFFLRLLISYIYFVFKENHIGRFLVESAMANHSSPGLQKGQVGCRRVVLGEQQGVTDENEQRKIMNIPEKYIHFKKMTCCSESSL